MSEPVVEILVAVVASSVVSLAGGAITMLVTVRVFGERLRRAESDIAANHNNHTGDVQGIRSDISGLRTEVGGVKSDVSYIRGRLEPREE